MLLLIGFSLCLSAGCVCVKGEEPFFNRGDSASPPYRVVFKSVLQRTYYSGVLMRFVVQKTEIQAVSRRATLIIAVPPCNDMRNMHVVCCWPIFVSQWKGCVVGPGSE